MCRLQSLGGIAARYSATAIICFEKPPPELGLTSSSNDLRYHTLTSINYPPGLNEPASLLPQRKPL